VRPSCPTSKAGSGAGRHRPHGIHRFSMLKNGGKQGKYLKNDFFESIPSEFRTYYANLVSTHGLGRPRAGTGLKPRTSRKPSKSSLSASFAGRTHFFRRNANGHHHHGNHLCSCFNRIIRRLTGHNDPLAGKEIQSTLRAKLSVSLGLAKNGLFFSPFPSPEDLGRNVGGSPSRWGPAGRSCSARHVLDGSTRVWPDSGLPRSTGFQPVSVHRGGFASAGYRRVRMKDSSSLRLSPL
jgi:hypothetical protein